MPFECDSYKDYIGSIYKKLRKDILSTYDLDDDYDSPQDMLKGYSASESELRTRNEILSAMVVYGFLSYHNETLQIPNHELMLARNLQALPTIRREITREDKSGKGYVDFLFKPLESGYPAIVLELKHDKTAEEAIKQIKAKNYIDRVRDCKEILLVGINYSEVDNKKHTCIIETHYN